MDKTNDKNTTVTRGKLTLRLPKDVHERLANVAKEQNVSLNTLIVSILSEHLGKIKKNKKGGL